MSFDPYDSEDILKSKDNNDQWELYHRLFQLFQWDTYLHSLAYHPGQPDLRPTQASGPHSWLPHPQPSAPPSSVSPRQQTRLMSCPHTPHTGIPEHACQWLPTASILDSLPQDFLWLQEHASRNSPQPIRRGS